MSIILGKKGEVMEEKKKTVEELLHEIDNLPTINFERDPEFVANFMIGKIIESIYKELEKQGISQSVFADKLGKSKQYVSKVLSEKVNFTIKSLARISCALDCDLEITLKNNSFENANKADIKILDWFSAEANYKIDISPYNDKEYVKNLYSGSMVTSTDDSCIESCDLLRAAGSNVI